MTARQGAGAGVHRITTVAAAAATQSLFALALSVLLARLLGPAGRGLYALLTLTALIGSALGTWGFETGFAFTLSRRPEKTRVVIGGSVLLAFVSGTVMAILVARSPHGALPWLSQAPQGLVSTASSAIPFLILTALLNGILLGLGRVTESAWFSVGASGLSLVLVSAAFLLATERLGAVVLAFAAVAVMQAGFLLAVAMRAGGGIAFGSRAVIGEMTVYSLTSHASTVVHLLHLRADVLLVGLFLTPREVGLYALAQAVCEWVWLIPRSAATVLFPVVAASVNGQAAATTARTCRIVFGLAGLIAVCMSVATPWLVPTLFGADFGGSVVAIWLLLPGIWIGSVAGSLSSFLSGSGRPALPLLTSVVSVAINIPLNLALIPRYGIAGAAVASAVTYSLMTAVNTILSNQLAALPVKELFVPKRADIRFVWHALGRAWSAPWKRL